MMLIVTGVVGIVAVVVAYLNPRIRLVEDELPDAVVGGGLGNRKVH
jgi:hypothetical protein